MTTTTQYAAHELSKILGDNDTIDKVNVWIARGDGVAVYRNEDLGSADLGHEQFVSFGSPAAMLPYEPPTQLPDIGNAINWRYRLAGTYRNERLIPHLPTPDEVSWATPFEVCEAIVRGFDGHTPAVTEWDLRVTTFPNNDAKRFVVTLSLGGMVIVTVQSWMYDEGINRLDPFFWTISDAEHGDRDGSDPNLGGALVSVYNATLPYKD